MKCFNLKLFKRVASEVADNIFVKFINEKTLRFPTLLIEFMFSRNPFFKADGAMNLRSEDITFISAVCFFSYSHVRPADLKIAHISREITLQMMIIAIFVILQKIRL